MPARLLIAEHDADRLENLLTALARENLEILVTESGIDCAQQVQSWLPDLLIVEDQLPWGGASGVLALMQAGQLPLLPVIVLASSQHRPGFRSVNHMEFPFLQILTHPLRPDVLRDRVRGLLVYASQAHPIAGNLT